MSGGIASKNEKGMCVCGTLLTVYCYYGITCYYYEPSSCSRMSAENKKGSDLKLY